MGSRPVAGDRSRRRLQRLGGQILAAAHTAASSASSSSPPPLPSRVGSVNTRNIQKAVALACGGALVRVFNQDDIERVPFFGSSAHPKPELLFSAFHSESHVPGRHLNALLNAVRS